MKRGDRIILKDGRNAIIRQKFKDVTFRIELSDGTVIKISKDDIAEAFLAVNKICSKCNRANAITAEKFCKACKKVVLEQLKESGTLQVAPLQWFQRRESGPIEKRTPTLTPSQVEDLRRMSDQYRE